MDQIQNGQLPDFLKLLLTNPAAANQTHHQQLEALVQTYPQCSIFHLLLAKAAQNGEAAIAAQTLQSAAVHAANREVLFRLIHQPELIIKPKQETVYPFVPPAATSLFKDDASFIDIKSATEEDQPVVFEESISAATPFPVETDTSFTDIKLVSEENEDFVPGEIPSAEKTPEENQITSFKDEKPVAEQLTTQNDSSVFLNPEEAMAAENDLRVEDVGLNFINESAEEIVFPMEEVVAPQTETEPAKLETANTSFTQEIDEEVYDEITAIEDIRLEFVKPVVREEIAPAVVTEPEKPAEELTVFTVQDKAEKDMLSSIASIDYFTFNNKFGLNPTQLQNVEENAAENIEAADSENSENPIIPVEKEPETVSKYHDEKMPYTFMWWLDKTRKEYAGTYQPYVKKPQTQPAETGLSVGPELHQQYIESIFHTKPPHGLAESTLPPVIETPLKRKEDQLIERFIIEEPHIHPPSIDKLDTENKAKKSSEDGDILVTETLAKIYFDQMLYHKALDTYKKLLLKFPEKSRYFTAQIELIEKKIN